MGRTATAGTTRSLVCALAVILSATGASAQVLGKADGDKAGTRIEITQLKRLSGNRLSLQFVMINASNDPISFGYNFIHPAQPTDMIRDDSTIAGVYLQDGATTYAVDRNAKGLCACSSDQRPIAPKSRRELWRSSRPFPTR